MPRSRLTSCRCARSDSGTAVIQRMTVAISPFSEISEPQLMATSRTSSNFEHAGGTRRRPSSPYAEDAVLGLLRNIWPAAIESSAWSWNRRRSRKRWWKRNHCRWVSSGTKNIDSRSSSSSNNCEFDSPVTLLTRFAHILSSTDRRSRSRRLSSAWAERTSSLR